MREQSPILASDAVTHADVGHGSTDSSPLSRPRPSVEQRALEIAARDVAAMQQFATREGHLLPPREHLEDGIKIATRITQARMRYRRGALPPAAQALYESLPGWRWRERDRVVGAVDQTAMLKYLRRLSVRGPIALIPGGLRIGGVLVNKWVTRVRKSYDEGTIEPTLVSVLESIPGWSWDAMQHRIEAAAAFFEREGHLRVLASHVEGDVPLGTWLTGQRTLLAAGNPSARLLHIIAALDALDPSWRIAARHASLAFERGLAHFRAFVAREGHGWVPTDHRENGCDLRHWIRKVRRMHVAGDLSPELTAELNGTLLWSWTGLEGLPAPLARPLRAASARHASGGETTPLAAD